MSRETTKLSEHRKNGQFSGWKKFIFGQRFYFGLALGRATAEAQALALVRAAEAIQAEGGTAWNKDAIQIALQPWRNAEPLTAHPNTGSRPRMDASTSSVKAVPVVKAALKLHAACDLYLSHLATFVPHQISQSSLHVEQVSMSAVKHSAPNIPLDQIGFDELTQMVGYWTARPISDKTGKPFAVDTIRTRIAHLRKLFEYLADSGKWEECRRFERIFKIKLQNLFTNAEKKTQANGVQTFTVQEIKTLFSKANEQQRLLILLGLNTASTNYDLATLLFDHIQGDCNTIKRERHKTNVLGVYDLWPETQKALRERIKQTPQNEDGLALLTADGKPLVWYARKGYRIDSVLQSWNRLLLKCKDVQRLPFKYIRKTAAQLVLNATGSLEVTRLMLSHSGIGDEKDGTLAAKQSIAEKHYVNARDFTKLSEALKLVQKQLADCFTSPLPKRTCDRTAQKARNAARKAEAAKPSKVKAKAA